MVKANYTHQCSIFVGRWRMIHPNTLKKRFMLFHGCKPANVLSTVKVKGNQLKGRVSDEDLHWFGSPGSGSVLGKRIGIGIQEQGNWPKLTNKLDFQPFKWLLYLRRYSRYVLWHFNYVNLKKGVTKDNWSPTLQGHHKLLSISRQQLQSLRNLVSICPPDNLRDGRTEYLWEVDWTSGTLVTQSTCKKIHHAVNLQDKTCQ